MTFSRKRYVKIVCNPSFSVANWFSRILQVIPAALRRSVVLELFQALLQVRSSRTRVRCDRRPSSGRLGELIVGRTSYHITDAPAPRHLRACKEALRRKFQPVLVVPGYAIGRAHRLPQLAIIGPRVQIVSLETLFAVGIVFAAAERGRAIPDMWAKLISEYNRGTQNPSCPEIILEWSSSK